MSIALIQVALAVLEPGYATCPNGQGGWVLSASALPPPFARFCEYTYTRGQLGDPLGDIGDLEDPAIIRAWDAELGWVLGQNDATQPAPQLRTPMSTAMSPMLWALFQFHADIPTEPAVIPLGPKPRLAIIDTAPEHATQPRSVHAPSMTAIARSIACAPSGQCAAEIKRHLAMPRIEDGAVDRINGGYYGTLWDLARAIAEAVRDAQASPALVLNLSLGWRPELSTSDLPAQHLDLILGTGPNIPAPERAVHAALVYARCSGAAIYAASGNLNVSFQEGNGPLLPAAWSKHRSPTRAECTAMYGAFSRNTVLNAAAPLLTSIGGVDHADRTLENARPGSTPELSAPSSGVWVPGAPDVITGTSVGTIVASVTSALLAAYKPSGNADDWVEILRRNATPLGRTGRISVCRAQRDACASRSDCRPLNCAAVQTPPFPRPAELYVQGALAVLPLGGLTTLHYGPPQTIGECVNVQRTSSASGPYTCPNEAPIAAENLDASPQPVDPMCPICWMTRLSNGQLWLAMSVVQAVPGDRLFDTHLAVRVSNGAVMRFQLDPKDVLEGTQGMMDLNGAASPLPVISAWLEYNLHKNGAVQAAGGTIAIH
jgi:hypothetical protein